MPDAAQGKRETSQEERWRKASPSYFPILVMFTDTGEQVAFDVPSDIPAGRSFIVLAHQEMPDGKHETTRLTPRQKAACDAVARIRRGIDGCECMTNSLFSSGPACGCEDMALAALRAADAVEVGP